MRTQVNPFGLKIVSPGDFCVVDDDMDEDGKFVNLLDNPERFTGYAGSSAAKVWQSIYHENCFNFHKDGEFTESVCMEQQVFYRLVSGLHTSISMHICGEWLDRLSGVWIKNTTCYYDRVKKYPERLDNLLFLWGVMERSIAKSVEFLEKVPFVDDLEDSEITKVI